MIYLHALLKLEKEGKAVLIYLENSYCNTTHPIRNSGIYILVSPLEISRPKEADTQQSNRKGEKEEEKDK